MRHCVGCHNYLTNVFKKGINYSEKGFNKYSLCFPETVNEMATSAPSLNTIFYKECGGLDNIQFGSSVIFRAILTSLLLYNTLKTEWENRIKINKKVLEELNLPRSSTGYNKVLYTNGYDLILEKPDDTTNKKDY